MNTKPIHTRLEKILTKEFLINEYVNNRKSTYQIAEQIDTWPATIRTYLLKFKIKIRDVSESHIGIPNTHAKSGSESYGWKGGRIKVGRGYIFVYAPWHPKAKNGTHIAEHRLVMERHLGRYLTDEEIVHHINGDKSDNRIENLMLFPNIAAHNKHKHLGHQVFTCKFCGKNQGEK